MQEYTVSILPKDALMRLDLFVLEFTKQKALDLSRTSIQKLIKDGFITINSRRLNPNYKLKAGDSLDIRIAGKEPTRLAAEEMPLEIIYEDRDILVINKPVGLVVHPAPGNYEHTLVNALLHHTKDLSDVNSQRPGIVHRLDKETSGVMVVAKNNAAHLFLTKEFSRHTIKKIYVALVRGRVEFDEGIIDIPIGRHKTDRKKMAVGFSNKTKEATTRYRTLRRTDKYSLLELMPQTGRTHQLRVHLAHMGHPIIGDSKYGKADAQARMYLHAKYLGFTHPRKNKFVEFSTDVPAEFLAYENP